MPSTHMAGGKSSMKKVLYPTDFSTAGRTALEMATCLARDRGATLLIVHVEEPPVAYGGGDLYYGVAEPDREEIKKMLADVVPADPAVPAQHMLMVGDPAAAIVQAAED